MIARIKVVQGDFGNPIEFNLQSADGTPLSVAAFDGTIRVQQLGKKVVKFTHDLTVEDGPLGKVSFSPEAGDFDQPGEYIAEIRLVEAESRTLTFPEIYITVIPSLAKIS